jgi:hypothetical protein
LLCFVIHTGTGAVMNEDISYQLGFVHGQRSLGMQLQWMSEHYVRGYCKGVQSRKQHLEQEEKDVIRSGHQGLRQTASDTAVLSEAQELHTNA